MTSIYSIGHGRHPFAYFLELLRQHEIEFVCDVRSFHAPAGRNTTSLCYTNC